VGCCCSFHDQGLTGVSGPPTRTGRPGHPGRATETRGSTRRSGRVAGPPSRWGDWLVSLKFAGRLPLFAIAGNGPCFP